MSAMRVVLAALAMGLLAAVQAEECSHLGERCTSKADCCWKTSCCGGLCCDQPCGDSRCADPCYAARSAQACEAVASECQWCYTPTPPAYQQCNSAKNAYRYLPGWTCFHEEEKVPVNKRLREDAA
eukprot:Hpha_TRINITY_DN11222_c0_g1::TRINITY_DN11222_c0_g1_i1::g.167581::m.167581